MTALDMNPEIRDRWTAALRSGQYPQGKEMLRTPDGWCCLGVLCDLAEKAGVVAAVMDDGDWIYDGEPCHLPVSVMTWAGLSSVNPEQPEQPEDPGDHDTLAGRNDDGVTFADIADLIEGRRPA